MAADVKQRVKLIDAETTSIINNTVHVVNGCALRSWEVTTWQ
jgi:hypothetical protein